MALFIDITSSLFPQGTRLGALHIERALTLRLLHHGREGIKLCFAHPASQKFHEIHRPTAVRILSGELHAEAGDLISLPPQYSHQRQIEADAFRDDLSSGLNVSRAMARLKARTASFSAQDFLSLRQNLAPSPLKGGAQELLVDFSTGEALLTPDDVVVTIGANAKQIDMRQIRQNKERTGFRYVAAIHNFDALGTPHLVPPSILQEERAYLGELIWAADQLLCFSKSMQTYVKKYLESWNIKRNVDVISPGYGHLHRTNIQDKYNSLSSRHFFLHVADAEPYENHQVILKAFEQFIISSSASQDLTYVCAYQGGTQIDEITHQVNENATLHGRVLLLKLKSSEELSSLYSSAKFTVIPSVSSGDRFQILNSIFFQKPFIASRTDHFTELINETALYADPYNPHEWEDHIKTMSDSEFGAEPYAETSSILSYQWDHMVGDFYNALYQSAS